MGGNKFLFLKIHGGENIFISKTFTSIVIIIIRYLKATHLCNTIHYEQIQNCMN